jgi:hypothetical protein
MSFWLEAGGGVRRGQGEKRQLTLSKGPGRMGIRRHGQGTDFPSKGVREFFLLSITHPSYFMLCMLNKKESLCAG